MKRNQKGHRMSNITDEQLIDAVKACHDKSASDIAHYMEYDRSTISRHLKELECNKIVTHRDVRGAGGMLALWSLTGKKRCSSCDKFLEYTGVEWACPECQKELFEDDVLDCFKQFSPDSIQCKMCCIAVECYEASQCHP